MRNLPLRWVLCLAAMFNLLILAQAYAAEIRLPPVVIGKWCYLGTEGLLKVPGHPDAQLYEDCRDGGGGGCEDITFAPGGMEDPTEPDVDCKPRYPVTKTTQTIYGLDAIFTDRETGKTAFHLLLNMIAPRRMLITFYPVETTRAADNTQNVTLEKQLCFVNDPSDTSFNVRAQPNKQSRILVALDNGYKVSVFKRRDNWALIQTVDNKGVYWHGWVYGSFLTQCQQTNQTSKF